MPTTKTARRAARPAPKGVKTSTTNRQVRARKGAAAKRKKATT